MQPYASLAASITAAAVALAEGRSADEIALLATVFTQLGDTLALLSIGTASREPPGDGSESQTDD